MKGKNWLLLTAFFLCCHTASADDLQQIIDGLKGMDTYQADARLVVMMPQQPSDVVYDLSLSSFKAEGDKWAPCDYLIEWSLDAPSGKQTGFGAYFDGHHYRYRGTRLQEYHVDWDSVPFMPGGNVSEGVQCRVQFANTLPAFIARDLEQLASTPGVTVRASVDTIVSGRKTALITTERQVDGMAVQRACYAFDPATFHPIKTESDNNIGALSEQTVVVEYANPAVAAAMPAVLSEEWLVERYPEPFERFRENNFRVENLPGSRLPQFSLETIDGSRFNHAGDDTFARPVILTFIDPATGYNDELIAALRQSAAELPVEADLMLAFMSNNIDQISEIVGRPRQGEKVFTSARSLSRHLGVTDCPVVVLVGSDARVADVILGYNKDLATIVIQKMAFVK